MPKTFLCSVLVLACGVACAAEPEGAVIAAGLACSIHSGEQPDPAAEMGL